MMGWWAVDSAGTKIVGDAFESKIDKYIRNQRKKGIILKKLHDKVFVPSKKQLRAQKERRIQRID